MSGSTPKLNPSPSLPSPPPASQPSSSTLLPSSSSTSTASPNPNLQIDPPDLDGKTFTPFDPQSTSFTPLSSDLSAHPLNNATLTIRIVKSFGYRTFRALVLRGVDLERETVGGLLARVRGELKSAPGFKAYRNLQLDTLKLYTVAHGSKTTNLIINLDHDEWILDDPDKTLAEIGAKNETELSFFNRKEYEEFKANPEVKWD